MQRVKEKWTAIHSNGVNMAEKPHPLQFTDPLKTIHLDPKFKYEIAREPGGESIKYCFQCGKCTATCPIRRLEDIYNPRRILRAALLGLREVVLSSDVIWLCVTCFSCTERCPQGVRLSDVMRAIRNLAVRAGYIHPFFKAQTKMITEHGRIFENSKFINEQRADLGLPPISQVNVEEISQILSNTKAKEISNSKGS